MRRIAVVVLLTAVATLVSAPTALAGIWTPIASGTTSEIRAIDYQAADRFWYATANGRLAYRNPDGSFSQGTGPGPGVAFNDIAFQPGTGIGLAVGNFDNVWRTTNGGVSWTQLNPKTNSNDECANTAGVPEDPGDLYSISWGAGGVVYLGGDKKTVLRSQDAGLNFTEINKTSTGCQLGQLGSTTEIDVSELQVVSSGAGRASELVYFQGRTSFGPLYVSANGLTGEAVRRSAGPNGTGIVTNFVVDPSSPNRGWASTDCGFSCFVRTTDSFSSISCVCSIPNDTAFGSQTDHYDIAYAGGTVLAVGDGGMVEQSVDGTTFFFNVADAPDSTTNWRAVALYDGAHAAVGGASGRLVVTDRANSIPDLVAPTAVISGPTSVVAGRPATFTANATDNAGGSGIDPASFAWTATGTAGGSANPVTLTFPSSGSYTVRVTFKDLAGNTANATLAVTVGDPVVVAPPRPVNPVRTTTVTVAGGKISLGAPRACIPAGTSFTATLSFKKATRKGALFVKVSRVEFTIDGKRKKIDRKAPFRQRLTVKNLRAGTKHTLRARATIKVKRGKSPKKSISTRITVCG